MVFSMVNNINDNKTYRSYHMEKISDNMSLHVNLRFLFHLVAGAAAVIGAWMSLQNSIRANEYNITELKSRVIALEQKHQAEIEVMQEELKWYQRLKRKGDK